METREKYGSKLHFWVSVLALLLTPQSLISFPIWVKQNGGASVLIPYTVCVLTVSSPMVFLELSLGQFMQRSGTRLWNVAPLFKGIGISSTILCLIRSCINVVIASWSGFYIYLTLTNQIPACNTSLVPLLENKTFDWSQSVRDTTTQASSHFNPNTNETLINATAIYLPTPLLNLPIKYDARGSYSPIGFTNSTEHEAPTTLNQINNMTSLTTTQNYVMVTENEIECRRSFERLWRNEVLRATPSVIRPGNPVLHLLLGSAAVVLISIMVVALKLSLMTKMVALQVTLTMLVGVAIPVHLCLNNLSGAIKGISYLWTPDLWMIAQPDIWARSCHQAILTHSLSVGVLPSLSSFNRWNNNTFRDTLRVSIMAVVVNVFASVLMFAALVPFVDAPPLSGIPMSLSFLPHPAIWTCLFFLLIILNALTTNAIYWTSAVLTFTDASRKLKMWRVLIVIGIAFFVFLLSLPLNLQSGIYIFRLLEFAAFGPFVTGFVCLLQCVAIAYFYGGTKLYDNLETMTGHAPHWWMRISWAWLCPPVLLASVCYHGYKAYHQPISLGDSEPLPHLSNVLLLLLVCVTLLPVLLSSVWVLCSGPTGCVKKLKWALRPRLEPYQIPIRWRLEGKWNKFSPFY